METENNFDIITGMRFGEESVAQPEPQEGDVVQPDAEIESGAEGESETEQQPDINELMARIQELEAQVAQPNEAALSLLQDRQVLQNLAKDYEQMPIIDVLREDFEDRHQKLFELNPELDREVAFRKYLQRAYNPEIEPLIEDTLGLDDYDFAVLQAQVSQIRAAKMEQQSQIQQALSGQAVQREAAQENNSSEPGSIAEYEQRLLNHIETGLKQIKPSAMQVEGLNLPSVGEDRLKELVNSLSIEEMPLMVAQDNNVYPHIPLLKELADHRELVNNLPQMLQAFKEKIVAETVENLKRGVTHKTEFVQSPSNVYSGDVISPKNIGEFNITGLKL